MRYFVPRLKFGPLSPPQDHLEDKFGGLPWGLPLSRWPVCSKCGRRQSLIAQLMHDDDRLDLGKSGRVLHIFQCGEWLEQTCPAMEPGSGANSCFIVDRRELREGVTEPAQSIKTGVESRVISWAAKEDGIDPSQYQAFFNEHSWLSLDEETTSKVYLGTKVGSVPAWDQSPRFSLPPEGLADWRFVVQVSESLSFEGPPPAPDVVGCRVVRQVYIMDGDRFVRSEVESVEEPRTTKVGAPDSITYLVNDNKWLYSVANFGMGCGYAFIRGIEGLFSWQR